MSAYLRDVFCWILVVLLLGVLINRAHAHDHDPSHTAWYRSLHQPDFPQASCCGEADAYWCDDYGVDRQGRAYCVITDLQDDAPLGRQHVPVGTKIFIPKEKLKWEEEGKPIGNPTGHGIVFLSRQGDVYCFVQAGGV